MKREEKKKLTAKILAGVLVAVMFFAAVAGVIAVLV